MGIPLRVLILEDRPADAELMVHELRQAGYDPAWHRVETEADYLAHLQPALDLILADYTLPQFDAPRALRFIQERNLTVPIIVVTGSISEEVAVECMKQGAADYLLKNQLTRLGPAISHALERRALRDEHRRADARIRHLNDVLRAVRAVNALIVRERNSSRLLAEACTILLQTRGYRLVWIGQAAPGHAELVPVAQAGDAGDFLAKTTLARDGIEAGQCPTRIAYRTRQRALSEDIATDPGFAPCREAALGRGYASAAALPLLHKARIFGVLTVYADRPGAFDKEELDLLDEVSADLAFTLQSIEDETKRRHAEVALAARTQELVALTSDLEVRVQDRTQELEAANQQLQAASRHKSEFLANMSHELRTPLNSILGFAQILQEQAATVLSEKQARYLAHIYNSGQHLLRLINDILDLSKVEAGKFVLQPETLRAAETLEDILVIARGLANKKGQMIEAHLASDLPPLQADPVRFKQILFNLLSNAVKFTPEQGTITVTARRLAANRGNGETERRGAGGSPAPIPRFSGSPVHEATDWLEIAVRDTGVGIRAEDLPRLFGEFVQLETTRAQHYEGTGLGLALTRRLVELHGGRIWAASGGEGKGSTFTIVLPFSD